MPPCHTSWRYRQSVSISCHADKQNAPAAYTYNVLSCGLVVRTLCTMYVFPFIRTVHMDLLESTPCLQSGHLDQLYLLMVIWTSQTDQLHSNWLCGQALSTSCHSAWPYGQALSTSYNPDHMHLHPVIQTSYFKS